MNPQFQSHEPSGMLIRREYTFQDLNVVQEVIMSDCYWTGLRRSKGKGEQVVDVGAHIGSFAMMWHRKNPDANIVCIEACPENIPILQANVGSFATVIHAACSYSKNELMLLNSVRPGGTATGGSIVVDNNQHSSGHLYWLDNRPLKKITLEEIFDRIDILKLDCEGSEFDILANADIDRLRFICGEYHGLARWDAFRKTRFEGWDYGHMHSAGGLGIFHYVHPKGFMQ